MFVFESVRYNVKHNLDRLFHLVDQEGKNDKEGGKGIIFTSDFVVLYPPHGQEVNIFQFQ